MYILWKIAEVQWYWNLQIFSLEQGIVKENKIKVTGKIVCKQRLKTG